jgi:hypothetical protein
MLEYFIRIGHFLFNIQLIFVLLSIILYDEAVVLCKENRFSFTNSELDMTQQNILGISH